MPNPSWPASLPPNVLLDLVEEPQPIAIQTQMDQGPPKRRKRFTANIRRFRCRLILDGTQRDTFYDFWKSTANGGATPFDWKDLGKASDPAATLYFTNPPPVITRIAPDRFIAEFTLETQPA